MGPIDVKTDFLEALQHHPYYLSEFLIYKQQQSGWSKEAYLRAMEGELGSRRVELHLLKSKAKAKAKAKDAEFDETLIGRPLVELTEGKVNEYFTLRTHKSTPVLNADALATFDFFLKKAWTFNDPPPVYSNLQIISFAEQAVEFILDEFKIQAGEKDAGLFFRNPPRGFRAATEDGRPVHLLYYYLVAISAPVFDYYLFEDRFRELLLNSRNLDKLVNLATRLFKMGKEIVRLWNEKLAPLEEIADETVVKAPRRVSFSTEKRNFTFYMDASPFTWDEHKRFSNYQLTVYAANIGHLAAAEIPEISDAAKNEDLKVKPTKPPVAAYAIMHIYWGKHDETKALTKTNKKSFAERYGVSEITLFDHYGRYYERKNRLKLPDGKKEQKNSVIPFIQKFEAAALMLQDVCETAYNEIISDINHLKTKYQDYLD